MEIYKLNIDTTKPASQVVQMQQNSAGILSIDVTNDGKYIRNLSCAIYDGDAEITASKYGYKLNVGSELKHIKIEAKSQPYECSAEYILSAPPGTRMKNVWLAKVQLKAGTYHQDEFASLIRFGDNSGPGYITVLSPYGSDRSKVNFSRISIIPWNPVQQVFFHHADGSRFAPDELVIATEDANIGGLQAVKTTGTPTLSSTPYPAVGYYTNYQVDTLIKPSQNTSPYAKIEYDPSNIEAGNISADTFTLGGVTYVPTTLSVDGVAYSVLAAPTIEQS